MRKINQKDISKLSDVSLRKMYVRFSESVRTLMSEKQSPMRNSEIDMKIESIEMLQIENETRKGFKGYEGW